MKKMISLAIMAFALLQTSALAQETTYYNDLYADDLNIELVPDNDFKAHVQADFVSHYMWRGTDMGGISIQPELGVSWKGLSLNAFGNAGFDKDDVKELDITLGYGYKGFNIGITDYWATGVDPDDRYFFYKDKETAHQFEANFGYSGKYFSLQAYTMFWGNDYKINGDRAYSTYVELSVPFRAGGLDWDARVGITPFESAGYATTSTKQNSLGKQITVKESHYFYGEGFACNMASIRATKNLQYKSLRLPIFAEIHTNPYLQKANFLVGISVIAF
jgi:hypothetical protein